MDQKNDPSNYDRAAEWCKRAVKKGHNFLFDTDAFDAEMRKAASELCFPMEVSKLEVDDFMRLVRYTCFQTSCA